MLPSRNLDDLDGLQWETRLHLLAAYVTNPTSLSLTMCACAFPLQEVAEPLQDLKEGMEQLEKNKTLRYILSTLLAIGNFLNGSNVSHRPSSWSH